MGCRRSRFQPDSPCHNRIDAAVLILLALLLSSCGPKEQTFTLSSASNPWVFDADGDGDHEIVWGQSFAERHSIFYGIATSRGLQPKWQRSFPPKAWCTQVGEIGPGGRDGLFVTRKDSTGSWIEVYSLDRELVLSTAKMVGVDADTIPGWDGSLAAVGIARGRGREGIVASVHSGNDCYPRGIVLFDLPVGNLAWIDSSASYVRDVRIVDLDGDGSDEIVYTTHATGNGCVVDGDVDRRSGIAILDLDGHHMARRDLGGIFSLAHLEIADLAARSGPELTVVVRPGPRDDVGRLLVLDARLDVLGSLDLPGAPHPQVVGTLDGEGKATILVGHDGGELLLAGFDGDRLVVRQETRLSQSAHPAGIVEYRGKRVFVVCGDSQVWLLDGRLAAKHVIEASVAEGRNGRPAAYALRMPVDLGWGLVLMTPDRGLALVQMPAQPAADPRRLLLILTAAVVAGVFIHRYVSRSRRPVPPPIPSLPPNWQEILLASTNLSHGDKAMSTLSALARRVREGPRIPELVAGLGVECDHFRNESVPKIKRLVDLGSQLENLRPLAHEVESQLDMVRRRVDTLASGSSHARDVSLPPDPDVVAEEFIELADSADTLRDQLLAVLDCDVSAVIEQALAACRTDMHGMQEVDVEVSLLRDGSQAPAPATIWPDDLRQILCDVIRNALEAMSRVREPRLKVVAAWQRKTIEIRVGDNGRGIARERWESIFARDSSKGEDGGTGLPNARKVLADYRGRIEVEDSTFGLGTTILIAVTRRRASWTPPSLERVVRANVDAS